MRNYIIDDKGDERTVHIGRTGEFFQPFHSVARQVPSQFHSQAISPTRLWIIPFEQVERLYDDHPILERVGRKSMEYYFLLKEERLISFIRSSAEERYLNLLSHAPDIVQNVPLSVIASYLGMSAETLSRVRGKIRV